MGCGGHRVRPRRRRPRRHGDLLVLLQLAKQEALFKATTAGKLERPCQQRRDAAARPSSPAASPKPTAEPGLEQSDD